MFTMKKRKRDIDDYKDIIIEGKYWKSWKYFLRFYKKSPWRTFFVFLISLIAAGITIAIPFITQMINYTTSNGNINAFIGLAISIFAIYIIKLVLDFLNEFLGNYFNYEIEIEWREILIEKIYKMRFTEFENRPLGDFISRVINDLKDMLNFAFQFLNNVIYVSTILIGAFIYVFLVNWVIGLIPLAVIIIGVIFYLCYLKRSVLLRHKTKGLNSRIVWKTDENIQLISEIKNYSLNEIMLDNFRKIQDRYLHANKKSNFQLAIYKVVGIATNVLTSGLILVIGSYGHLKGMISDPDMLGLTSASSILVLPLINLAQIFTDIIKISPALSRLYFWVNIPEEDRSSKYKPELFGSIEFRNVSFSYKLENGVSIPVLKNFNLKINENEIVNLYGHSGSGKTTIFNLLMKLYDVDEGEILIDDVNINDINTKYLRSQISFMHTWPKLFSDVFTNKELAHNKKFKSILKQLDIVELFEHKRRIDENLNSQGILLSEGEKQMLSFARSIYYDSKILIIDNIEGCLDQNQILKIKLMLGKLRTNKTIIVGTSNHRNTFGADKQLNL